MAKKEKARLIVGGHDLELDVIIGARSEVWFFQIRNKQHRVAPCGAHNVMAALLGQSERTALYRLNRNWLDQT